MSNYYISKCCQKPVGQVIGKRAVCPECKRINEVTAMIDSPDGVPEEYEKEEWGGWKFVSDMLDNPDEYGIYPTSICYKKLYDFVCEQKKKQKSELLSKIKGLGCEADVDKITISRVINLLR